MQYQSEDPIRHRSSGLLGRWLASRPAETWMFFAAGIFLGGLFF